MKKILILAKSCGIATRWGTGAFKFNNILIAANNMHLPPFFVILYIFLEINYNDALGEWLQDIHEEKSILFCFLWKTAKKRRPHEI